MSKDIEQKNKRNSSLELLRIISMIMIMFHHFAVHGGFEYGTDTNLIPHFWYNFIAMGGKIGSNIFVIISGYFLINNKKKLFDCRKILKFVGQLLFYSLIIYFIFVLKFNVNFELKSFIKACFPITFSGWWFASTYFVLFLIHPFINNLLHNLDKKTYQKLLCLSVICFSVISTFTKSLYQSNSLIWFILLYSIAGYIRIYGFNSKYSIKHYIIIYFIFSFLTYLSSILLIFVNKFFDFSLFSEMYFYGQEKINILLISISLFMIFTKLKIKYNKIINVIASATFGVYLIHDHDLVRPLLWYDIFKNNNFQNSIMIIPYSILVVFLIYVVCTIIELLRQRLFEVNYMKIINHYLDLLMKFCKKIYYFFSKIIFG